MPRALFNTGPWKLFDSYYRSDFDWNIVMDETMNFNTDMDPQLQKMLRAYASIPERDPIAAQRTRTKFLTELNKSFADSSVHSSTTGWTASSIMGLGGISWLRASVIPLIRGRALYYTLITLVMCGVFLFSGVGISVYAASLSLPGDALYPLKAGMETVQSKLTVNPEARARLYLSFAGRRLDEIQSLIGAGRYEYVASGANHFENDIQMALIAAESISDDDPTATALYVEIISILQNYNATLIQMLIVLPPDLQPAIVHAISTVNMAMSDDDDDDDGETGNRTPGPRPISTPLLTTVTPPATPPGSLNTGDDDDDSADGDVDDDDDGDDGDDDDDDDADDDSADADAADN